MTKNIVILGSTGSIGENVLRVVDTLKDRFNVIGLAANSNAERIVTQAAEYGVKHIAIMDANAANDARNMAAGVDVFDGQDGICRLASLPNVDLVVCAIVGMAALNPVIAAITAGHDVAIATKEVLVSAGEIICALCAEKKVNLIPIDSEHSALFQVLQDKTTAPMCVRNRCACDDRYTPSEDIIERLLLTASGGPFANDHKRDLSRVTVEEALAHPRWNMGPKVTIDSATMMNKGLEIIEARWLFNIPENKIDVLIHPESIIHSIVEFKDGAQLAQLSVPDMRLPIQYAMTWPYRTSNQELPRLNLAETGALQFSAPDPKRFPCLKLVRDVIAIGGAAPAIMNAANEIAVTGFLKKKIKFTDICKVTTEVLDEYTAVKENLDISAIIEYDKWARARAEEIVNG